MPTLHLTLRSESGLLHLSFLAVAIIYSSSINYFNSESTKATAEIWQQGDEYNKTWNLSCHHLLNLEVKPKDSINYPALNRLNLAQLRQIQKFQS